MKSKGKGPEDKLELEDIEAIAKIKEELKKMGRNLGMAVEDPDKWLALKLSFINKEDEGESTQEKFTIDLKACEANSSGNAEDYFSLFQKETGYMSNIEKDSMNEEPKYYTIKLLEERKVKNWKMKVP
ncbi:hypothetical protein O181_090396 [Austropuccinia psidii MF-1]|uniref:Uncharacterized protein n=1 Tax=Austropuccinia psidii MF-1 TaxID=1389203 RepID=A0A9Q3IVH5_9BASI|nr:hypothetical protein [Austropuccinia psidii MF-1]